LLSRLSSPQRASILAVLNKVAPTRLQAGGGWNNAASGQLRAGPVGAPGIGRGLPANDEGGEAMSEAEFEAARTFAERIIPDGDEPDAHHWVASGRRLVAAAYLMAGREDGKNGEAREDHAR